MGKNTPDRFYPLKLWVLTIVLSPILHTIWMAISQLEGIDDMISLLPLFIFFGFFFSVPAAFIVFLLYQSIRKLTIPILLLKLIVIGLSIVGMIITLELIDGLAMLGLELAYGLTILVIGLVLIPGSKPLGDHTVNSY